MMDDLNINDQVSILLVTHDPLSASYCQRILFIKDGKIHQEVKREDQSREEFLSQDPYHSRKLRTIRRKNTCFGNYHLPESKPVKGLYRSIFQV